MQPLISEAFELSTAVDTQLKVLKEYVAFTQTKVSEASAAILQLMLRWPLSAQMQHIPSEI